MLAVLLGEAEKSRQEIVRETWQARFSRGQQDEPDFEHFWRASLERGFIEGSTFEAREDLARKAGALPSDRPESEDKTDARDALELVFRPDPSVWDGAFANVAWQQELPRPFTKLTWDNAALISPGLANERGLTTGDMVALQVHDRQLEAPVMVLPGQADGAVTLHLGYGRTHAGRVGNGVGFNAYTLRRWSHPWSESGLDMRRTGGRHELVTTQHHHMMDATGGHVPDSAEAVIESRTGDEDGVDGNLMNRRLLRVGTQALFEKQPDFAQRPGGHKDHHVELSLYPEHAYDDYKWGMSIDLNACIGCNACTVACQAENNIPVVGKAQVAVEREMHWIRVDSYFEGRPDNPRMYHQPVTCMHCENAPCEPVCPVGATLHDEEGINNMVYNRCVGTRYCSNNCPYKVRRFNFLSYSKVDDPREKLQKNPNVTVRSRGVMEKCTYCIQRINSARIDARNEERRLEDGDFQTACQQVCPTRAISFGDLNNPESDVSRRKRSPRDYGILTELSTEPRTTYMARLRNPNPKMRGDAS